MIYYDTDLPAPTLMNNDSSEPLAFARSKFDYGTRQREMYKDYVKSGFRIVLKQSELDTWKQFWSNINNGAGNFYADFLIHGSDNVAKIVRFTRNYSVKNLGALKFEIICNLELLEDGLPFGTTFLFPSNILFPSNTLLPT